MLLEKLEMLLEELEVLLEVGGGAPGKLRCLGGGDACSGSIGSRLAGPQGRCCSF